MLVRSPIRSNKVESDDKGIGEVMRNAAQAGMLLVNVNLFRL